ncbi:tetratricopeptide repeat protein [Aliagarivorans taiwanensis]|uniref:tetratricopeptide repeat protein n=1 Tax=Aliagarivorans taiwanensis TaxID=561966 RepID=UPI0003FCDCC9|nr:tetratricopeptide repeat protein [Aliagarivorans taiwanensis]
MSVINKMLNDLEQRQQSENQAMSPLVQTAKRPPWVMGLVVLVMLISLVAAGWLLWPVFKQVDMPYSAVDVTEPAPVTNQAQPLQADAAKTEVPAQASNSAESEIEPETTPQLVETEATPADEAALPEPSAEVKTTALPEAEPLSEPSPEPAPEPQFEPQAEQAIVEQQVEQQVEPAIKSVPEAEPEPSAELAESGQDPAEPKATALEAHTGESHMEVIPLELSREQRVELHLKRAFKAMEKNDTEQAREEFSTVLRLDPSQHSAREQLAALEYGRRREAQAISLLEQGLELDSQHVPFRLLLARIFIQQQNTQQAWFYLNGHEPMVPGNVDFFATKAALAQQLGYQQDALSSYRQLVQYEPDRARWWFGYALANDHLGQYLEAHRAYQQASLLGQLSENSRQFVEQRIRQLEQ